MPEPATSPASMATPAAGATRPGGESRLRAWAVVVMLFVLMLINYADKAVLGLAAGPVMTELHLSSGTYGAISGAFFYLFGICAVVGGFLTNRVGSRVILAGIAILWALAQVPVFLSASVSALLISRISLGAFEGPTAPITQHATFRWFPDRRRSLPSALVDLGGRLGIGVAAPALTFLIFTFGWRSAFAALAVVSLLWAVIWLFVGREGPYSSFRLQSGGAQAAHAGNDEEPRLRYRRLFGNRTWVGSALCAFGAYWSVVLLASWVPLYLEKVMRLDHGTTANVVSIAAVLSGVSVLALPLASALMIRRGVSSMWARCVLGGATVAVCGACMVVLTLVDTSWLRIALLVVAVSVPQGVFPLMYMVGGEVSPVRQRAAAIATSAAVVTTAGLIAPLVMGYVIEFAGSRATGYSLGFVVSAVLTICFGTAGAVLMRPARTATKLGLRQSAARS